MEDAIAAASATVEAAAAKDRSSGGYDGYGGGGYGDGKREDRYKRLVDTMVVDVVIRKRLVDKSSSRAFLCINDNINIHFDLPDFVGFSTGNVQKPPTFNKENLETRLYKGINNALKKDLTKFPKKGFGSLFKPGSCNLIDDQVPCITNGRPDVEFQKLKWKPKQCTLPRLNGGKLLEMIRGRRLAFVGDSLNRNMWESLICILKGSVKVKSQVFEAHGRHQFRWEAEYSFVFKVSFFQQSTICFITC
ncbi:unnamed protein product [Brassica oleracea]